MTITIPKKNKEKFVAEAHRSSFEADMFNLIFVSITIYITFTTIIIVISITDSGEQETPS